MAHRAAVLMLAVWLASCGKDAPSGPTPQPTAPVQQCRRHATAFTSTSTTVAAGMPLQSEESATCLFDSPTATLRCTAHGWDPFCPSSKTTTTVYASVVDFVEEAIVVGRVRYRHLERRYSSCNGATSLVESYTYDAGLRPLTRRSDGGDWSGISTFAAWDTLGRPTQETHDGTSCPGQAWSISYDDAARTVTSRKTAAGSGRFCSGESALALAYDPDGNLVREQFTVGGAPSWSLTSTITATDSICF